MNTALALARRNYKHASKWVTMIPDFEIRNILQNRLLGITEKKEMAAIKAIAWAKAHNHELIEGKRVGKPTGYLGKAINGKLVRWTLEKDYSCKECQVARD